MPEDDPFSALGLPARFDLEPAQIERAYLARVASVHPDLGDLGDKSDQAADSAAALNLARQTLLNPETRASALLSALGFHEEDKSLPDGFLMEIMDVRMELEEAFAEGDAERIARWQRWADDRRKAWIDTISGLFGRLPGSGDSETLSEIKRSLNAWRYIERMIEQAGTAGR